MPIEPPGRRDDQRVDADDFAIEVEQRPAGIAAVDGGVGLDVVVVGALADVAVARRDDAGRDRAAEAERIADRDHPFAEPQLVGIAELHRDQRLRRLELQHREIGLLVDADQFGLDLGAVVHDDVDLVGIRDDVIVGDDDACGIDDEAGAERIGLARLQMRLLAALGPPPGPLRFLKKSSKNSSNGEPGGNCGIAPRSPPPPLASTVCEVEILTTASITFSATSAMPSGPRAKAGADARTLAAPMADRGPHQAQATAQGGTGTGHVSSLSRNDRNLRSTVRPNGSAAQAFEPDISAKNRPTQAHDFVDLLATYTRHSGMGRRTRPQMRNCTSGNLEFRVHASRARNDS